MSTFEPREFGKIALRAVLVAAFGLWLSPLFAPVTSVTLRAVASATLGAHEFGVGGRAHVLPVAAAATDSWDMPVALHVDGVAVAHQVSLNPRRLLYLPVLTLVALVVAVPLTRRGRLYSLTIALPLCLLYALGCVWLTLIWLFSRVPGLVYTLSSWQSVVLRVTYEALVTSLVGKFALPLMLVVLLASWLHTVPAAAQPAPAQVAVRRPKARRRKRQRSGL